MQVLYREMGYVPYLPRTTLVAWFKEPLYCKRNTRLNKCHKQKKVE